MSLTRILFIDVEGLILDVPSLLLGVARTTFHWKVPAKDTLRDVASYSIQKTSRFLTFKFVESQGSDHNQTNYKDKEKRKCLADLANDFVETTEQLAETCKPYMGALMFLEHLNKMINGHVVFVTTKPSLVIPCLTKIATSLCGMNLQVSCFQDIPTSKNDSRLYFLSNGVVWDSLISVGSIPLSGTLEENPLSFFFLVKSLALLQLCHDTLRHGFTSKKNIMWTIGFQKKTASQKSFFSSALHDSFQVSTISESALPLSLQYLDLSPFYEWAEIPENLVQRISPFRYPSQVTPLIAQVSPLCLESQFWNTYVMLKTPIIFDGLVVKGFGRGGSVLGIPTANLNINVSDNGVELPCPGVYFGMASLFNSDTTEAPVMTSQIYSTILSAGYNPYYDNEHFVVEAHLFDTFPDNFHGVRIRIVTVGFLRPEANFLCLEHLIQAIQLDCDAARNDLNVLQQQQNSLYKSYCNLLDPSKESSDHHTF